MLATGAAETGSETTGSSALASSATGASGTAGVSSVAAGVSDAADSVVGVLGDLAFLKVLRRPEKGDFGFSESSSLVVADLSFLEDNHGRELLRLSLTAAGVSTAFASSPLVTVSAGTVAGVKVEAANGSVVSTAGITGAVSLTAPASLAGTAGAASVSDDLASFFAANLEERVPKKELRLEAAGLVSATGASSTGAAAVSSAAY